MRDAPPPWEIEAIRRAWPAWTAGLEEDFGPRLARFEPTALAPPNGLVVAVDRAYNWFADACEAPEARARIEARLAQWLGRSVSLRIDRPPPSEEPAAPSRAALASARDEVLKDDPMVKQVVALFEAKAVRVEVEEVGD